MRSINWTRRTKLFTGIGALAVVLLAAFLVVTLVGTSGGDRTRLVLGGDRAPGAGALLGTANSYPQGGYIEVFSDWFGAATGVIELRNNSSQTISLESWPLGSDGDLLTDKAWGSDSLAPGQTKTFDYKGSWRITASPVLPAVVSDRSSGGGGGEGGLKMGPYGGR